MRKLILLFFIAVAHLLVGSTVHAQTQLLFDYASQWKYLDNGSNQGTAWKDVGFNDGSWNEASGIFGYGDPWITVCLTRGATCAPPPTGCTSSNTCTKYITYYFRKTINIANTSLYSSVNLNVWRDDAVIIYVNGVKVSNDPNMPTGTVTYITNAINAIDGSNENTPVLFNVPISAFVDGDNLIAIEVHQRDNTSSDITFNMQAQGVLKTTFLPFSSQWKYLTGSDQGTAWRDAGFNDASWLSGNGRFGYGETFITTCLQPGPSPCATISAGGPCSSVGSCTKYPTAYFRRTIDIPDVSVYDSVRFSLYMDDGIVIYVNGVEEWRSATMPTVGTIPKGGILYTTQAPSQPPAENTITTATIPIDAFVNGDNQIAIELHQNGTTTSDADFDAQITGVIHIVPALVRGPYLQMGNDNAFTVRWRTNVACKSKVEVGTVFGTYPTVVNDPNIVTDHEVRVTGLTPDTKYYYRFGSDLDLLQGDTTNFYVTAPVTPRRVTIAAYGDCGRNDNSYQTGSLAAYKNYLSSIGLKAADMMILIGDNAYNSGTDVEFQNNFFNAYQGNILKNHMLFPAPGNHDYNNGSQFDLNVPYYSIFSMPQNGECGGVASNTEAYYSYDWGDVHFLSLDSYGKGNGNTTRMYDTMGAQVQWIKADLAANTKKWVIAYWHHPPYTMGSHNSDGEAELINIRQNFIRILERYGVDLIICGHSHDYERSYLMKGHYGNEASFNAATHAVDNSSGKYDGSANSCPYTTTSDKVDHGTVYVVSGSAGASGGVQGGYPHNAMPFSFNEGGMFFMDINNNRLDAKFINKDGNIRDQFTIMHDVDKQDTVEILHGTSTDLTASWEGNYSWAPGVTARTVSVAPTQDTLVEVKDNATNTCLVDKHYVNMLCTMPDITSSPANIVREGCDATVTYAIADTGRPTPAITYSFAGATTGSGNGTGSGTTFSVGVTTVTITAANECGSTNTSFTVTILPLPTQYNMTGGGGYCPGGSGLSVGLSGSQTGVEYQLYSDATAIGTAMAGTGGPLDFGVHVAEATYSVLATDLTTNCTVGMATTTDVFVHNPPVIQNVTGGGNYCAGTTGLAIGIDNSQTNVNYQLYAGATAIGSAVAGTGSAVSFGVFTATGTYTVHATDAITTCVNDMNGSATIVIDPLPAVHNVAGGGHYCSGGIGMPVGMDNTDAGINYQLYDGFASMSGQIAGVGGPISFGNYTPATTYTVLATNATTGCVESMAGSATVVIDPLPVGFAVSPGGNYCSGGSGIALGLAGSQTDVSYQLYYGMATSGSAVIGTGAAISFGNRTGAGGYTVEAINTITGCENIMTGSATIGIYGLPTVYSVTGGGTLCAGASGVAVGLGGSSIGINYRLHMGSTPVGSIVPGTGSPISFGSYTSAGSYNVIATDVSTTCNNNMAGTAAVAVTPLASPSTSIAVFPNDTVCEGTTVVFNAMPINGGLTPGMEWKVNGTTVLTSSLTYSYVPMNGDVVSVVLYSSLPCITSPIVTSDRGMTVMPNVMPAATITASPGDSVCEGTLVTFAATSVNGGTDPVYRWMKNSVNVGSGTSYTYAPTDGDGIVVAMTSNAPCRLAENVFSNLVDMKVDESYIPVVSISAIPGEFIAKGQPVTFTAHVSHAGAMPTYKWRKNSTLIAGAVNASYTTSELSDKDTITCIVKGSGLCGLDGFNSMVINVAPTSVTTLGGNGAITVVPNPTTGVFNIEGSLGTGVNGQVTLTVSNVLGQEVYHRTVVTSSGNISERVSLGSNLADGTYLLTVNAPTGKQIFHVIMKR